MASFGVTEAQDRLGQLVDRTLTGEKITVETAKGNIVMITEEDWDSVVEALSALSMPTALESVECTTEPIPLGC